MKKIIDKYFSLILLTSCFIGLWIPDIGSYTNITILGLLFTVVFISFFQVELNKQIILTNAKKALVFYLIRYILLPVAVFLILQLFSKFYAIVFLLMYLLPAAVSSPAFSTILKGNPVLSLVLLVMSSFLSIFSIPFFCGLFASELETIHQGRMFITLVFTLILPYIVHLPLKKIQKFRSFINFSGSLIIVICLSIMLLIVFSKYKTVFLNNPLSLLSFFLISISGYAFLIFFGWIITYKSAIPDRITGAVSSGVNNIGLGITLSAIYFPEKISLYFVVAEFSWVLILIPLRKLFLRKSKVEKINSEKNEK